MWFQKTNRLFAKSIQNAMTWSHWIDESGKSDIWTFSTDVVGQGHRKSGQLCLVLVRPDRQTTDSFFFENSGQNPDSGQIRDRQNPDRTTSDSLFYKNPDEIAPPDRIFNKMYYSISNSKLIWANRGNKIQKLGYHQAIFTETSFCGSKNFIGKKSECSIEVGNFNRNWTTDYLSLRLVSGMITCLAE